LLLKRLFSIGIEHDNAKTRLYAKYGANPISNGTLHDKLLAFCDRQKRAKTHPVKAGKRNFIPK